MTFLKEWVISTAAPAKGHQWLSASFASHCQLSSYSSEQLCAVTFEPAKDPFAYDRFSASGIDPVSFYLDRSAGDDCIYWKEGLLVSM